MNVTEYRPPLYCQILSAGGNHVDVEHQFNDLTLSYAQNHSDMFSLIYATVSSLQYVAISSFFSW